MHRLLVLAALFVALPAGAVTIDWVYVGDPGNAPDTATSCESAGGCGSVPYSYYISKYEVTNAQYAEFLNAKAASDPLGLYNTDMGADASYGGIARSGADGSYTYAVKAGFADKPVNYVSFFDSLRFANWLNNGQGSADTETGAYTLVGGTATPTNGLTVTRNAGATIVLTSADEWYKAAYHDAVSASYFDYPAGSDAPTTCAAPGPTPNTANCGFVVGDLTVVGSYTGSASPNGTFDQGGNVSEWNETILGSALRGRRGGSFSEDSSYLSTAVAVSDSPWDEGEDWGFRVALVPEPCTALLVMTGLLGLTARRRRRH